MEKFHSEFIGVPILSESERALVGVVADFIIDPNNGRIEGIATDNGFKKVIPAIDILKLSIPVMISEMDAISDMEDIIKIKNILSENKKIIGNKVFTKSGIFVGKVYDYAINLGNMHMTKLAIAKSFLGLFHINEVLLPTSEIIEITPEKIIINDIMERRKVKNNNVAAIKEKSYCPAE
ncbi:MAG: PRC-barrel domain-containing protein [Candidatus Gracilibacteria bacterium]|jgi:sporulation protein YlmC with PRC-barrel domain